MAKRRLQLSDYPVHSVTYEVCVNRNLWRVVFLAQKGLSPYEVHVYVNDNPDEFHNDDAKYCSLREAVKWVRIAETL